MSSNMRALIEMKRRDQAQEEVRYRENQNRSMSNAERRGEQIASIAHIGNVNRARREIYSGSSVIYADGGPVQGIEPKGFVPVKVSNGEFEFTPEQVANIGAAMLASKEQVPA